MDMLEAREDEAWRQAENEAMAKVDAWNREISIGTVVCGTFSHPNPRKPDGEWVHGEIYAKTTTRAYRDGLVNAVVDVEGKKKLHIHSLFQPEGSSPALAVPCSKCGAKVGKLCTKFEESRVDKEQVQVKQQIAHKVRREAAEATK